MSKLYVPKILSGETRLLWNSYGFLREFFNKSSATSANVCFSFKIWVPGIVFQNNQWVNGDSYMFQEFRTEKRDGFRIIMNFFKFYCCLLLCQNSDLISWWITNNVLFPSCSCRFLYPNYFFHLLFNCSNVLELIETSNSK